MKEELVGSGFISIESFNEDVVAKGDGYAAMQKCKKMQSHTFYTRDDQPDPYRFEIKKGAPLRAHHLYALNAYCDFTQFCTAFSETFRKMRHTESIASVNQRNSKFYFCSRYLREVVTYYGCIGDADDAKNGHESGPFYTGMSVVLNLPQFKMGLQGLSMYIFAK